jgi:uncharacterized iron-regulated membrane protein
MRALRSVLFWIHLVAGVVAGAIVLVMSATGVALTYQRQVQHWADVRGLERSAPAGATPLTADSLMRVVMASAGGKTPSTVLWRVDPDAPVEVSFGRDGRAYVDPYTGAVLGTGNAAVRQAFSAVTDWHRWLAMRGDERATGRAITGAANLAFLVLVLTGAWLWWPRTLSWRAVRQVLWFRGGLSAKARDFNWHHVIGVWSLIPLVVVVASGVVISYPWASRLVYAAVGEAPPRATPAESARPTGAREANAGASPERVTHVGDVAALATAHEPTWTAISLAWPKSASAPLVYTIDAGTGGEPQKRGTLTISRTTDSTTWVPFGALSTGRRVRSWMRFLHTGEALGLAGQTLAGLVSLGAVVLVYTGLALSVRRLGAYLGRRGRATARA